MITITFDDAVNDENWDLYINKLFPDKYKNPNGCPIHGTFYVSHQYTNYAMVQQLWNKGRLGALQKGNWYFCSKIWFIKTIVLEDTTEKIYTISIDNN